MLGTEFILSRGNNNVLGKISSKNFFKDDFVIVISNDGKTSFLALTSSLPLY